MVSKVYTLKLSDEKTVEFPRFTMDDLAELEDTFKEYVKCEAVKTAKKDKLDDDTIWRIKMNIDSKTVDISQLFQASKSPRWAQTFILKSLEKSRKTNPAVDVKEVMDALTLDQKLEISEKLILDYPEVEKHEKPSSSSKEGEDPQGFTTP